jgi:hypothetical protein
MAIHPINPATSLPMTGDDFEGVDIGGSPYGVDVYEDHHPWSAPYPTWDTPNWENF